MKRQYTFWLLVTFFVPFATAYATSEPEINFLLAFLSNDSQHNTVLSGYIDHDELPSKLKKKVVSIGYKSGDLVPAKCVLPSLQSKKGEVWILIPPAKDLLSKNKKDWNKLGSFHPILFDTAEKWKKRNEVSNEIKDPNAIDTHIAALKDNSAGVRRNAIQALETIDDPRRLGLLISALGDRHHNVREDAAAALGRLKDPRALEPLIAALKDDDSYLVRNAAADALGRTGDPRAVEPLIAALNDERSFVRKEAAWALGNIKDPRALEPLIAALKDDDYEVRRNVVLALAKLKDPRILEPLIGALKDSSHEVLKVVVYALANLEDPRSVGLLIAELRGSNNWKVRSSAKSALDKIDPNWTNTEAAKQLVLYCIDALETSHPPDVRENAARVLGYLKDPRAVEPLIAVMMAKDTSDVPQEAAYSLGWISDRRAVEALIAAMMDEDMPASVKFRAVMALGRLEDPRAVEPLIAVLKDNKSAQVREEVVRSLRQITGTGLGYTYDEWMKWWNENKERVMKRR